MKKLLLLLIIPFLGFGQTPNCDDQLVSSINIDPLGCGSEIEIVPTTIENISVFWDTIGGWITYTETSIVLGGVHLGDHFVSVSNKICSEDLIINVPLGYTDDCGTCDNISENDCSLFEIYGCVYQDLNCDGLGDPGEGASQEFDYLFNGTWSFEYNFIEYNGSWDTDSGFCYSTTIELPYDFEESEIILSQNVDEEQFVVNNSNELAIIQINNNMSNYELNWFNCLNPCYSELEPEEVSWLEPLVSPIQFDWESFDWGCGEAWDWWECEEILNGIDYWSEYNLYSITNWDEIPWNSIALYDVTPENFLFYIMTENISCPDNLLVWENLFDYFSEDSGCYDADGNFYTIGSSIGYNECEGISCEGPNNWVPYSVEGCEEFCDTIYIEIPLIEYIDCDSGLPCTSGMGEIIDKSKTDEKIYNLLGQEVFRRDGIYIEGGEIKYRF